MSQFATSIGVEDASGKVVGRPSVLSAALLALTGVQTISNGATTAIAWDTKVTDLAGEVTGASGSFVFTVGLTGLYLVTVNVVTVSALMYSVLKKGSSVIGTGPAALVSPIHGLFSFTTGDVISVVVTNPDGSPHAVTNDVAKTNFSLVRIF